MHRAPRRSPKLICSINMTAFLSIQVVLLVLLMGDAQPHGGWFHGALPDVDRPKIAHPVAMLGAERDDATIVAIKRDGTVFLRSDRVNPRNLSAKVRERLSLGGERKVYINADARARYIVVREVEDAVRAAGVENIAFLARDNRPF